MDSDDLEGAIKHVYVLIGHGSAQCIIALEQNPKFGETIAIKRDMIKCARSKRALLIQEGNYLIVSLLPDQDIGHDYGKIPWISLERVE